MVHGQGRKPRIQHCRWRCRMIESRRAVPRQIGQHRSGDQPRMPCKATRGFFFPESCCSLIFSADADNGQNDSEDRANRDDRVSVHRQHPLSGMPPDQRSTAGDSSRTHIGKSIEQKAWCKYHLDITSNIRRNARRDRWMLIPAPLS